MSQISRLKARARELKTEVFALYAAMRHPRTPWYAKLLIVAIVAYALSPIDLIPDFIPVLGFLDDILLLPLGIVLAVKMIPPEVMRECRANAGTAAGGATRIGRAGAAAIVLLWIVAIVLVAMWARSAFAHSYPASVF
jgi:uncharacterized membrane protein YkvA (DUF1232 family)